MEEFFTNYIFPNLHYYIGFLILIVGFLVTNRVSPYMKKKSLNLIMDILLKFFSVSIPLYFIFFFSPSSVIGLIFVVSFSLIWYIFFIFIIVFSKNNNMVRKKTLRINLIFSVGIITFALFFRVIFLEFLDIFIPLGLYISPILVMLFYYLFNHFWEFEIVLVKLKNEQILGEIITEDSSFILVKLINEDRDNESKNKTLSNKSRYIKKEDIESIEKQEKEGDFV